MRRRLTSSEEYLDTAIILCGGQGTRFRAVSSTVPKALASVGNRPFIDTLIDNLVHQNIKKIILATGHLAADIEAHVGSRKDVDVVFSREAKPLGTGGALIQAANLCDEKRVLVLNGDSYINFSLPDLLHFHDKRSARISVLISAAVKGADYGGVVLDAEGRIVNFSEKNEMVAQQGANAGIYLLDVAMVAAEPLRRCSLETNLMPVWVSKGVAFGNLVDQAFHDIGTPDRYRNFQDIVLEAGDEN